MADLYGTGAACAAASPPSPSSAAATAGGFPLDRDDFSIFLHNLLQSSASSSASPNPSSAFMPLKPKHLPPALSPPQPPPSEPRPDGGIVVPPEDLLRASGSADFAGASCRERDDGAGPSSSLNLSDPGGFCSAEASERTAFSDLIASSAKRRSSLDDLGSDSQKGPEAAEMPSKPAPPRSSSKRSRAAEVHNLSEKRRRSRINEKMKALQMLIPNSNKTDKASMLDEAIEYLKQLQLQVQMLSMRNGLSLHSLYVPGVVQPMQLAQVGMGFEDGNGLPTANGEFSANQGAAMHSAFDISNECTPSHQPTAIPAGTHASNSLSPFGLEPSIPAHYGPFNPSLSSKEICREDTLPLLQLDMGMAEKKSSDVSS